MNKELEASFQSLLSTGMILEPVSVPQPFVPEMHDHDEALELDDSVDRSSWNKHIRHK